MKKLLGLLLATSAALWPDTLVSGSSTYDTNIVPFNSDTSFDLVLAGGDITGFDAFHFYQIGAKGASNQDFTSSFSFGPVPYFAVGTIGISTDFAIVIDGVTYAQGNLGSATSITPAEGSTFTVTLDLTPSAAPIFWTPRRIQARQDCLQSAVPSTHSSKTELIRFRLRAAPIIRRRSAVMRHLTAVT